jgi:hypothetical protein
MGLPIYKILVQDSELLEIALVDEPAIEEDFLKFNKEDIIIHFNSDKQIISGLVMLPNKLIYRNDKFGERYVYYDEETVAKSAQLFLKNGMKFNEYHTDSKLQLDVIESYLTKEQNEFNAPAGSWVITAKINDEKLWNRVKSGEFNGFSFQSLFVNELVQNFNKQEEMKELKEKLAAAINSILFNEETVPVTTEVVEEVAKVENFESDEFKSLLSETLESFKTSLLAEIDMKIGSVREEMNKVNEKVEEFSKQPIVESVTVEKVANPADKSQNKATEYFKN